MHWVKAFEKEICLKIVVLRYGENFAAASPDVPSDGMEKLDDAQEQGRGSGPKV